MFKSTDNFFTKVFYNKKKTLFLGAYFFLFPKNCLRLLPIYRIAAVVGIIERDKFYAVPGVQSFILCLFLLNISKKTNR